MKEGFPLALTDSRFQQNENRGIMRMPLMVAETRR